MEVECKEAGKVLDGAEDLVAADYKVKRPVSILFRRVWRVLARVLLTSRRNEAQVVRHRGVVHQAICHHFDKRSDILLKSCRRSEYARDEREKRVLNKRSGERAS